MKGWQEDLLNALEGKSTERELFERIAAAARLLGFENCAYGLRLPLPLSNPRTLLFNDYPVAWQQRYQEMDYLRRDSTVLRARRCQKPMVWSDEVFTSAPALWREAQDFGLRVGWAQSSLDANGLGGMLTLARGADPLTAQELAAKEPGMRWLVSVAHVAMSRRLSPRFADTIRRGLTEREIEVLKWTADGKTSGEISGILAVSENTVNFHVKNAVCKLQSANKTSAVVRAAMLGLLN